MCVCSCVWSDAIIEWKVWECRSLADRMQTMKLCLSTETWTGRLSTRNAYNRSNSLCTTSGTKITAHFSCKKLCICSHFEQSTAPRFATYRDRGLLCIPGYSSSQVCNSSQGLLIQALNSHTGSRGSQATLCDMSLQSLFKPKRAHVYAVLTSTSFWQS